LRILASRILAEVKAMMKAAQPVAMNSPKKTGIYPNGFLYFEAAISEKDESEVLKFVQGLHFLPYVMRGQASRRGIVRFGHDYGPVGGNHHSVQPLPPELIRLRERAQNLAGISAKDFVASVVTQYPVGATIGWHSDMTMFGPVVFGFSIGTSCVMKLRSKADRRRVFQMQIEPRSLYVMKDEVRSEWEHSIPPVKSLRYSITFRTVL
jgi:alkylated DNA repair dioxygenase AlkB